MKHKHKYKLNMHVCILMNKITIISLINILFLERSVELTNNGYVTVR